MYTSKSLACTIYSVVKDFRGCFKGEFWCSNVLLFHLEAIYLLVLKSLFHMYEMYESLVAYTDLFVSLVCS